MVKILSQSGNSLADVYDVVGSVAGIDQLISNELSIVHEMGATLFSERLRTTIRRTVTGNIAQSTSFNATLTNFPSVISRLLGAMVFSDDASRISNCVLSSVDSLNDLEIPIWVFSGNSKVIRYRDNTPTIADFDMLLGEPGQTLIPNFTGGSGQGPGQADLVTQIAMRGTTTAFGAGTVFVRVVYLIAFPVSFGLSSRGLPIPSW